MRYLIFLFIIICLASCFGKEPETAKTGLEGKPLPAFQLQLPDSITYLNTANITPGKPMAIFYFSPFCPYCRAQTTEIIEDMDRLKEIQFYFVTPLPYRNMKDFYDEYNLGKYPNIITGVDTAHFINDYFELTGVPFMAVYDKNKILNKAFLGKVYSSQIKKAAQ